MVQLLSLVRPPGRPAVLGRNSSFCLSVLSCLPFCVTCLPRAVDWLLIPLWHLSMHGDSFERRMWKSFPRQSCLYPLPPSESHDGQGPSQGVWGVRQKNEDIEKVKSSIISHPTGEHFHSPSMISAGIDPTDVR
ncbi:hypothetical protein BO86DRAFT_387773 [Aspergillus japonicus CBS 114.51]|uniref:Uncharacterized protein n=1 Tax=Aspergillus japonicus CBS 114.51 TaxID=1448312 RepID=A0A8T8X639_ASPJA|nr:hypothetical protein BO86DRAFT_387773 [Aspergillus japonicus CBS 114.51]RAH83516.1 hypothetical protein BO86DRAFT_387773 [Aspergillus japonicus CBS 114.51]